MAAIRFTLRQLDAFVTVADTLSFSAAGTRLFLTPSAVSQLIGELESVLEFKLFDRTTRRVAVSAAGREFLPSAQSALRHLRLAESAGSDVRDRAVGIVRIAAPQVIAATILPELVARYLKVAPKVRIRIRDCAVEHLVDLVANGDADLAIGPDRPTSDEVASRELFPSPWVLWCSPAHPLAKRRSVRWSELRAFSIVAAGRDHERSVSRMRQALPDEERITPIDVVDNITTALGIAAANIAVTVSPAYVASFALPHRLVMLRITHPEVMRRVSLYWSKSRQPSPASKGVSIFLTGALQTPVRKRPKNNQVQS